MALVAAAFFFGSTFVVVKDAVEQADPLAFIGVRFLFGALVLLPLALRRPATPGLAPAAIVAGSALATGYVFQTVGLQYTTSSVSAFITYLLVVIVPLLSALVLRRPPQARTLGGIALAVVGLALLTGGGGEGFGKGEALTVGCAVAFAAHIVIVAHLVRRHDPIRLTAAQVAVVGAVCVGPGFVAEGGNIPAEAWAAAVYTGVAATAVALTLQVWAQQVVGPSRTALILLLEPVFAGLLGYATGDRLGAAGLAGAGLILIAVLVTEASLLTAGSSSRESDADGRFEEAPRPVRPVGPP